MSLRTAIQRAVTLAVVMAVVFASTVVRRAAVEPLQSELTRSRIHHTFRIAEQLRSGSSRGEIRDRMHLAVTLKTKAPWGAPTVPVLTGQPGRSAGDAC